MSGPPNKTERAQDTIFPVGKVDSQWRQNWYIYLLVHALSFFPAANLLQDSETNIYLHHCDFNKKLNEPIMATMCLPSHLHLFTRVHSDLLQLRRRLPLITSCIRL